MTTTLDEGNGSLYADGQPPPPEAVQRAELIVGNLQQKVRAELEEERRRQILEQRVVEVRGKLQPVVQEAVVQFLGQMSAWDSYDFAQTDGPTGMGSFPAYVPPLYRQAQKRGEFIPVYLDEYQLRWLRDRSRKLCEDNAFAKAAIENRINYIGGEDGLTIKAIVAPGYPVNPANEKLAERAQKIIDRWAEYNEIWDITEWFVARGDVDGDAFMRSFRQASGLIKLRPVQAELVKSPVGMAYGAHYSFGVQTDPDDVKTIEGYWIIENPDRTTRPVFVPARDVRHIKRHTPLDAKRGMPMFYSCELLLRMAIELLRGVVTTANARARFAVIRKFANGIVREAAQKMIDQLSTAVGTDPTTGQSVNIQQMPFGSVVNATGNTEYEFPGADISAGDYEIALQMVLRAAAARSGQPEWMFTADASNGNFSSALVAEAPSYKSFSKVQKGICRVVGINRAPGRESLAWQQIQHAVACGILHPDTLKVVSLSCEGPTLVVRDKSSEALMNRQYYDMKVKSRTMIQGELGIDTKKVEQQLQEEAQKDQAMQKLLNPQPMVDPMTGQPMPAGPMGPGGPQAGPPGGPQAGPGGPPSFSEDTDSGPAANRPPSTEAYAPSRDDMKRLIVEALEEIKLPRLGNDRLSVVSKNVTEGRHEFSNTQLRLRDRSKAETAQTDPLVEIIAFAGTIPDGELVGKGKEDDHHITIKYGLHTSNPYEVGACVREFGAVTCKLGRSSVFECKCKHCGGEGTVHDGLVQCHECGGEGGYDVVKIDVTGRRLHHLNALLKAELDHTDTYPKYQPHLTIAYVRKGHGQKYTGWGKLDGTELYFDKLNFSAPDGMKTDLPLNEPSMIDDVPASHAPGEYKGGALTEAEQASVPERLDLIADILLGVYGEDAEKALDVAVANLQTQKKQTLGEALYEAKSGIFRDKLGHRYRLEQGRRVPIGDKEQPKPRQKKALAPAVAVGKRAALAKKGDRSPKRVGGMASDLTKMDVGQLRNAKQQLGLKGISAQTKKSFWHKLLKYAAVAGLVVGTAAAITVETFPEQTLQALESLGITIANAKHESHMFLFGDPAKSLASRYPDEVPAEVREKIIPEPLFTKDLFARSPASDPVQVMRIDRALKVRQLGDDESGVNETAFIDLPNGVKGVWKRRGGEATRPDEFGNVKHRRVTIVGDIWRREVAASELAVALGFDDMVPVTVARRNFGEGYHYEAGLASADDDIGSCQMFMKDARPAFDDFFSDVKKIAKVPSNWDAMKLGKAANLDPNMGATTAGHWGIGEESHKIIAGGVRQRLKNREGAIKDAMAKRFGSVRDVQKAAVFDFLIMNTDRHMSNWMVDEASGRPILIDNGFAFPNTHNQSEPVCASDFLNKAINDGLPVPTAYVEFAGPEVEDKIRKALTHVGLPEPEIELTVRRAKLIGRAAQRGDTFTHLYHVSGIRVISNAIGKSQ